MTERWSYCNTLTASKPVQVRARQDLQRLFQKLHRDFRMSREQREVVQAHTLDADSHESTHGIGGPNRHEFAEMERTQTDLASLSPALLATQSVGHASSSGRLVDELRGSDLISGRH